MIIETAFIAMLGAAPAPAPQPFAGFFNPQMVEKVNGDAAPVQVTANDPRKRKTVRMPPPFERKAGKPGDTKGRNTSKECCSYGPRPVRD